MNRLVFILAVGILFALSSPYVMSAAITIDFNESSARNASTHEGLNYSYAFDNNSFNLNVRGLWGFNGGSINGANVETWKGYGLGVYDGPDSHRIGNDRNEYEMVVLDFGQSVVLNSFTVFDGRRGVNNFASVLAYTGEYWGGADSVIGGTWDKLIESGFAVAGGDPNHFTGVANDVSKAVPDGLASQFWLVGVYNAAFAESMGVEPLKTFTEGFKLSSLTFSVEVSEVPLPAAAWLFLTGLAGMTWLRKRKPKQQLLSQAA